MTRLLIAWTAIRWYLAEMRYHNAPTQAMRSLAAMDVCRMVGEKWSCS